MSELSEDANNMSQTILSEQSKSKFETAHSHASGLIGADHAKTKAIISALEGLAITIAENTEALRQSKKVE